MKTRTVLSMEQALSLTYATRRFVELGWRVIRLESTPHGSTLPGDPNRYIGEVVVDDDRCSYFIAPNVGKEAIALNLKEARGQKILKTIIEKLNVDVFCCNTLPSRYEALGIDYRSLTSIKPDIIWAGLSAMGTDYPDVPGYDPALQAMAGYMELTGDADGPPTLSGVPIIDLKAGDEVYANVLLAMLEKAESGKGKAIYVSMLQAAASWLITTLPLIDFDCHPSEISRCGNEHRKFIPVNAYPTRDGHVFVAVGNDIQWQRLTELPQFQSLSNNTRKTNSGRRQERESIHKEMAEVTERHTTAEIIEAFSAKRIPCAPIHTIQQVRDLPAISGKLPLTRTPSGKDIHLSPLAVDLNGSVPEYKFPPKYDENTEAILKECGFSAGQLEELRNENIIPKQESKCIDSKVN